VARTVHFLHILVQASDKEVSDADFSQRKKERLGKFNIG